METKANHVLIGAFTLATVAAIFGFILWLVKGNLEAEYAEYDILFDEAVTGLQVSGGVYFNGVKMGDVRSIALNPADPSKVRVRIRVAADTPIRSDARASIEVLGLVGGNFIQVTGGDPNAAPLEIPEGEEVPIITAEVSTLQEILTGVPGILASTAKLAAAFEQILTEENLASISGVLANANTLSGALANKGPEIELIIADASAITADLRLSAGHLREIAKSGESIAAGADEVINQEVGVFLANAKDAAANISKLADSLEATVQSAQPGVEAFSTGGLQEFSRFVAEARQLVRTLDRLAERIESDPARFLTGRQAPEYESGPQPRGAQ